MPEKRRKNNKNKRKNKNNRSEVSNISKGAKQINDTDANSNQSEPNCDKNDIVQLPTEKVGAEIVLPSQSIPSETQNVTDMPSDNTQVLNESNNNNESENKTQVINESVLDLKNDEILETDLLISTTYVVESPDQAVKNKPKLNSVKSKSLDSDDIPKIIELTEEAAKQCEEENNLPIINSSNVLVADVESDIEWEKTGDLRDSEQSSTNNAVTGTLSITTIPLDVAQCEQAKSLTPQEEISLRNYLKTLDLSTSPENMNSVEIKTEIEQIINREIKHRLRKKGITDDFLIPRAGHPRMLDVIDEEGSGESSLNSRRHSYLSDKKSDNESIEDDVFEDKNALKNKFSTKALGSLRDVTFGRLVPQQCILVGAKLKEPEVCEARGDWTMTTVEKMTGAEVVYLTDSSSSTSSIHEIGNDNDDGIESDVSIRMITPTIEVTDTENLLKNTFISKSETSKADSELIKSQRSQNNEHIVKIELEKDKDNYNADKDSNQSTHEIVVLSTDNIKTNLYVKDLDDRCTTDDKQCIAETTNNSSSIETNHMGLPTQNKNEFDLEIKVIKCELNDAINNLIKEVTSDSETVNENLKDNFTRQDSSSSICSSQCTAKYNPTYSSLNDVSNLQHDDNSEHVIQDAEQNVIQERKQFSNVSHVKDVFESVTGTSIHNENKDNISNEQPLTLKDICLKRVASFPFGDKILEELASVSEKLQKIGVRASEMNRNDKDIEKNAFKSPADVIPTEESAFLSKKSAPPPITPRRSSLKMSHDDDRTSASNKSENTYVCLSPSQKMLMEKTNTILSNDESDERNYRHRRISKVDHAENRSKEDEYLNNPPSLPFKSQTGSRLLALICDPSITASVNSLKKLCNDNIEQYEKKTDIKPLLNKNKESTRDFANSFKPIPPPRKISSSVYESDESSDFTDNSLRSMKREKKVFHFSTGNLNKEIESDISTIQNRHRFYTDIQEQSRDFNVPRRPSLPKDLCDQQMEYIRQKEKEVEAEIKRLQEKQNNFANIPRRGPRAPLISEKEIINEQIKDANNYSISRQKNVVIKSTVPEKRTKENSKISSLFSSSQEELQREKMYSEYVSRMAEREERKQHKIIKVTNTPSQPKIISKSMSALDAFDTKINNRIEEEFISKARQRWEKLGIRDPETEDESDRGKNVYKEPTVIEHKIKVIEGGEEKDVKRLPSHLQEFVRFTTKDKETSSSEPVMITPTFKARSTSPAVWRPNAPTPPPAPAPPAPTSRSPGGPPPPPPPPVWAPGSVGASPQASRKTYRPVHFEETPPARRKFGNTEQNGCTSGSESEGRLRTSQSAPATGLSNLTSSLSSRLPRAQNPTVTLLQKAREGQIPRGSSYLQTEKDSARLPRDRPSPPKGDLVHALRKEYASESEAEFREWTRRDNMADTHNHIQGIGPITKDGMPVALRSEVKDPSRWYKKMYDTIHKNKYDDDYVTIRYKSRRGEPAERVVLDKSQYLYLEPRSGYMSEPEGAGGGAGGAGAGGVRRRTASVQEHVRASPAPHNKYSTLASARASQEVHKSQPGRIEDYVPGRSSVVDKEAKQWWDEVMDIFDGWLDDNSPLPPYTTLLARAIQKSQNISSTTSLPQASPKEKKDITSTILSKSNMAKALKESGYESDSTLVFRRREDTEAPLSPAERRAAYRDLQAGGEPPIRGFRSPAPPRQDETEIEYIPISPTLTKIRIHKKTPKLHEVICYPITSIEPDVIANLKKSSSTLSNAEKGTYKVDYPPAPPRRISSKNSRTLKLVTSVTPPSRETTKKITSSQSQSNVDFLKDKISHKLTRQNTHIITKPTGRTDVKLSDQNLSKARIMSISAPPAVNRKHSSIMESSRKSDIKISGTSSFGSPRRTLLPIEYPHYTNSRCGEPSTSVVIEGGAGRRTPITNILDKVTSLDKLWSADKRNERIDVVKANKSVARSNISGNKPKSTIPSIIKPVTTTSTHKSRDMIRTAEKVQKIKNSNPSPKQNTCSISRNEQRGVKSRPLQLSSNISKSTSNITSCLKKQTQIKSAVVTNLKKKKSMESVVIRPRSVPCHESCSKKNKDFNKNVKKTPKSKSVRKTITMVDSESGSQFDDTSNETSNFGSYENVCNKQKIGKEITKSHEAVTTDSFFQHLFLGRPCSSIVTYPVFEQNTTVLQKAKMFQSLPSDTNMPKSLNSYLIHRKPVSLSRFKMWDRYPSPKRPQSPRSISWPGRIHNEIRKFDSLSKADEFGSTSSLATVRSRSEPPINKLYFSQTSRPKSPVVIFYKKDSLEDMSNRNSTSPTRLFFSQTSRPVSPKVVNRTSTSLPQVKKQSPSPTRIVFTETSRPISPVIMQRTPSSEYYKEPSSTHTLTSKSNKIYSNNVSRSHSTSPVSVRSPSYRRIYNARLQSSKVYNDPAKNLLRTRSAGDADKRTLENKAPLKIKSDSNVHVNDPEYDEYIKDIQNIKIRSERFRELNRYYTYLERVAELEKATSTSDLRHRKKDEEIIDFDRWKKIRAIERAEEELNNLYRKLKIAQSEKDVLFYPRDLKDFRWNFDRERGLRIKEKSVEDLKDHFQQMSYYEGVDFDQTSSKDVYKPLWRGTSVAETAFHINRKNEKGKDEPKIIVKPTVALQQDATLSELRKKIGLGSRLWSSLSMEQVNALKNQLNAIYSKELESKSSKESEQFIMNVSDTKIIENPNNLHVRCNSLISTSDTTDQNKQQKLVKSESIAAMPCPITSVKELKNNVNKIQMSLSENEKRRLSQTLSKELLDRMNKYDSPPLSLKQEIENTKIKEKLANEMKNTLPLQTKPKLIESTISKLSADINDKSETQYQSSASETETASSDVSNKTVIYCGPSKEVKKKVEYFESVKNILNPPKIIYHARENSDENEKEIVKNNLIPPCKPSETESHKNQIVQSQSCTDIKELFGESEKNKFLSLPAKPELHSRSVSPHSDVYISDRRTPDTQRYSSDETIWRSRSPSPDPERYWRAYMKLARAGEVRRLVRRFDSPPTSGALLRRHRSDPELARNVLNKNWSSFEKLSSRRDKCRAMLPVARVPLRSTNRFMPHIDIISKLAALRRRTAPRSRSAEEALECRPGEVNRIRRRFEAMSLLGQIYASAPDVRELHDIAPYLAGSWIAHRYPKPSDNNRSVKDPSVLVQGRSSPVKKDIKGTLPKESVKLSSILKSESLGKQEFDPTLHRPTSRYEPPRTPPRPPPAAWPQRLSPYVTSSKHTVKFQEADTAPEPPRRSQLGSYSDTESPRRYVESDVNIHYRCPVRHDPLPLVPERELARQQAEHMKRLYREQRRNKYLQELQDMQNRRHQDNFTPSQKTVVPLNRYDEADKVIAKALYTFNGQTARELSFRKGDIIHVRRQIDSNWYEGEVHGKIGLFPYNYVELQKGDTVQTPKKPAVVEGRARAKFDFTAQTNLELPLKKGEIVVLTRRIDQNWWEGRNGVKTGIFPDSYVTVLQEPSPSKPELKPILSTEKPMASPAAHGLLNGSDKRSMGAHRYTPQQNSAALANAPPADQPLPGYVAKPAQAMTPSERGYGPPTGAGVDLNNTQPLYVDTNAEAVPYRAMYKYRPQNPDELELCEGDTVYVLEKCDDGWYVGSSQRTGRFGTFPGNYVERI